MKRYQVQLDIRRTVTVEASTISEAESSARRGQGTTVSETYEVVGINVDNQNGSQVGAAPSWVDEKGNGPVILSREEVLRLPEVLELAARPDFGTKPAFQRLNGRDFLTYSASTLAFKREAWKNLPDSGIAVLRIRPSLGEPFTIAITGADARREFANVFETESWARHGIYTYSKIPDRTFKYAVQLPAA